MTDERFQRIERLVEKSGRSFEPATGLFESVRDEEDIVTDLDPSPFLSLPGFAVDECAEYVARKMHDYATVSRTA